MASDDVSRSFDRVEPEVFENEVLGELIKLHAQVLTRMPWVQTILVLGVGLLVFRSVSPMILLSWALLTVSIECLRAAYAKRTLKLGDALQPKLVHAQLVTLAAVVGGTVGLSAALFLPGLTLPDQAILVIILFTMPAAGVSVSVSSRQILAAYSLFILVPTSGSWIMLYPGQIPTVAGLTLLYWGFMISVAGDGEQLLRRSVAIRRERDRLVNDLKLRNLEDRAAVAKAEHSSLARGRVLAAASHDLRQPLHALSVYSAILASNPAPETLPEVARNIDRLVRALGELLRGLLDLSRLSSDYYVPERQLFSLHRVIAEVCHEYEALAEDKQLFLMSELLPVRLYDDQIAITRIARNLLDNAIKYTDKGEIRVSTRITAGSAELTVEDTGKGIPLEEQNRIFDEFYQLHNSGNDQSKGVGLGLTIVQRLCELIEARIKVVSKAGEGSRFVVSFNGAVNKSADQYTETVSADLNKLKSKRIYVVDDEIDILESMRLLLRAWGIRVETAASQEAAEALFRQFGNPDLLMIDLRLRGKEQGAELARRLQHRYGDFPVLVVTGETASEELQKANSTGYPLLQKPITAEVLYDALGIALR